MKLGSLFDGIGGFPLSAIQHGIEPVWASEIEPFPILVTKKHFPNMKHLGDITKINGAEIEPVEIITGGSPCQDLSVAGKRAGLAGERSGLFMEQIRIVKEMREHDRATGRSTKSIRPRFMVWENVPGTFSSNGGEDFRVVLEEIARIADETVTIPRPRDGKWNTAGAIMGRNFSIAWRVLDAQYWGVPQRRRRIFLVADFAGHSAGEILFKSESMSGDITESREKGQETSTGVRDGVTTAGGKRVMATITATYGTKWNGNSGADTGDHFVLAESRETGEKVTAGVGDGADGSITFREVAGTLRANAGAPKHEADWEQLVCQSVTGTGIESVEYDWGTGDRIGGWIEREDRIFVYQSDKKRSTVQEHIYHKECGKADSLTHQKQNVICLNDQGGESIGIKNNLSPTLRAEAHGNLPCIAVAFACNQRDEVRDMKDKSGALQAQPGMKQQTFVLQGSMIGRADKNGPQGDGINEDVSFTLNTTDRHAVAYGVVSKGNGEAWVTPERHMALNTGGGQAGQGYPAILTQKPKVYGICSYASHSMKSENPHSGIYEADTARTIDQNGGNPACNQGSMAIVQLYENHGQDSRYTGPLDVAQPVTATYGMGGNNQPFVVKPSGYTVRRLTPTECERLQGFPDDWTNIPGTKKVSKEELEFWRGVWYEWDKIQSKKPEKVSLRTDKAILRWLKNPTSDTARYKALGNSVAVPCVTWIMGQIVNELRRNAQDD